MNASEVSVQTELYQTCIGCEDQQRFSLQHGDGEEMQAVYACDDCGHTVVLALDP